MLTQREHELAAYQHGLDKAELILARNEERKQADNNPYRGPLYRRFVFPLADAIREGVNSTPRFGPKTSLRTLLACVDPEAGAVLAMRCVLQLIMSGEHKSRAICSAIGTSIYHEYLLGHFENEKPELFHTLMTDMDRRHSKAEWYRMAVMKKKGTEAGVEFRFWEFADRELLGSWMLQQLVDLGLVVTKSVQVSVRRTESHATFTDDVWSLVTDVREQATLMTPHFLPCVEQPLDWTAPNKGGFHTEEMQRMMPWCVTCAPAVRPRLLESGIPKVLGAINALQAVPWKINGKMLDTVMELSRHFDVKEIMAQADEPKPAKPEWLGDGMAKEAMSDEQLKEFVSWKSAMRIWYTASKARHSKAAKFATSVTLARDLREYPAIWFVYFADFRGRLYAQTHGLSPQGSDLQKSLLHFRDGCKLDDPRAQFWFKVHGANRWGHDKVDLPDRAAWVDEHHDLIMRMASDPVSHSEWMDSDKPLQFLAWALEYAEWKSGSADFRSRIPIAMDGSCNGLQHFSAMARDEIGGAATNLAPAKVPQDIYGQVATVTTALAEALVAKGEDPGGYLSVWVQHGITRKLVKRSVMTLPYGATRFTCADSIREEYLAEGKVPEFPRTDYGKAAQAISHVIWEAIGKVVVKAQEVMAWLQAGASKAAAGEGHEITWTTPTGLPVCQRYWKMDEVRVYTKLAGCTRFRLKTPTDKPDSRKHRNGISPNFVHSYDAAHLTLTVAAAMAADVRQLAMVHDDYGCPADQADTLFRLIREQFLELYTNHDPMAELAARYPAFGTPPEKGLLDLRNILNSLYFFS